ncbi:MAG: 2-amino-4-hydroxy-6-hydroxymethyldihydropteridine diphosphokinase [Actinomycetota bacterium]|nr:2-amino-4-hydroxy-6-hydroxymethyldihydropteridine diphosphokinase [Actinomycetota bacterium]
MAQVYLGLGSNIGNRKAYLRAAIRLLRKHKDIEVVRSSQVYETEPVGLTGQRKFFNMAAEVETSLSPRELLAVLGLIEDLLKRERFIKWGPRTIDIDILLFENKSMTTDDLTIPHPLMCERAFVLVPLLEIAPNILLPSGQPLKDFLKDDQIAEAELVGSLED